ncbi:MAG: hypothetical protein LBF40_10515 [Deltaproteobacteria bacterium]|jgi:hypothetical protein|nr:hypothetical protein [Deltaproteobacteria bacterium]
MTFAHLKEFAKRASMAYELSLSNKEALNDANYRRDLVNNQILERALLEAHQLSETLTLYTESCVLEYALALMELTRAYALRSDLEMVELLFYRIPRVPRSLELDFVIAQTAFLHAELSIKNGMLDKACEIYYGHFPEASSLGPELIRLDLAGLLVESYLDRGELEKAKRLFYSYMPDDEIRFFCPVPADKDDYAREEFSRILQRIGESLLKYSERNQDTLTFSEIGTKLGKFADGAMGL